MKRKEEAREKKRVVNEQKKFAKLFGHGANVDKADLRTPPATVPVRVKTKIDKQLSFKERVKKLDMPRHVEEDTVKQSLDRISEVDFENTL